jgi:hypothetical protein
MMRTKEPPNSTRSRHMRTTTGKKTTRQDTSTRSRLWDMQIRRWSGHRKLIGSPREPREGMTLPRAIAARSKL